MEIKVSVRGLVEFLLRTGDIDNRKKSAPDDAMAEGSRIHRMIQKKMGSSYHAEVMLRYRRDCGEYDLVVEGRADGIIDSDPVAVDEAATAGAVKVSDAHDGISEKIRQKHVEDTVSWRSRFQ